MKRAITLFTAAALSFAAASSVFAADTKISLTVGSPVMTVNGEEDKIDENGTVPVIVNVINLRTFRINVFDFAKI